LIQTNHQVNLLGGAGYHGSVNKNILSPGYRAFADLRSTSSDKKTGGHFHNLDNFSPNQLTPSFNSNIFHPDLAGSFAGSDNYNGNNNTAMLMDSDMNGDQKVNQLKRDLLESNETMESFKKSLEELQSQIRYKENQFHTAIKQKEDLIQLNQNVIEELRRTNDLIEIKAKTCLNDFNVVNEEKSRFVQENSKFSQKITELMNEEASYQVTSPPIQI
jgi:hypothetical protein